MAKRSPRSDEGRLITVRVPTEIWAELERFAPFLMEVEKARPGTGIKRVNPNALANYCIKSMVTGLRAYETKIQQARAQARAQAQG